MIEVCRPERVRFATADDAPAILSIYAPFCRPDSRVSFEFEPPSEAVMRGRILETTRVYPWLVLEREGRVAGYAYASRHHERQAYTWSVNTSIYMQEAARGSGAGRRLYERLFDVLAELGYVNAFAGISLPNPASQALHRSCGFEPVALYRRVGFKGGEWIDVAWYQKVLKPHISPPPLPRACGAGSLLA